MDKLLISSIELLYNTVSQKMKNKVINSSVRCLIGLTLYKLA